MAQAGGAQSIVRVLLDAHAESERLALAGDRPCTYRELAAECHRVRRASVTCFGEASGTRLAAILSDWTSAFVACFLGLVEAGWTVGVLDPAWTEHETAAALGQLKPEIVVFDDDHLHDRRALQRDAATTLITSLGTTWRAYPTGDAGSATRAELSGSEALFYAGFTSGSARAPKTFVRSHRSWIDSLRGFDERCSLGGDLTFVIPGPLSSSHFLFGLFFALFTGGTARVLPASQYTPSRVLDLIRRLDPARGVLWAVPTILVDVLDSAVDLGPLDYIVCAGARLDVHIRERLASRLPETRLVEFYGASELSFVAIRTEHDGSPPGSVGRAFPGVQIGVRDENGEERASGEVGEIYAKSALVFAGYLGEAPSNGARELQGGWWTVGDLGYLDSEGYLTLVGRGSTTIITGGANVAPEEVEQQLATFPGVAGCAVVGLPDPRWGEIICAAIAVDAGQPPPARAQLRRHVANVLAPHKRPRRYVMVTDRLPLNRSGKVDRARLREQVMSNAYPEVA